MTVSLFIHHLACTLILAPRNPASPPMRTQERITEEGKRRVVLCSAQILSNYHFNGVVSPTRGSQGLASPIFSSQFLQVVFQITSKMLILPVLVGLVTEPHTVDIFVVSFHGFPFDYQVLLSLPTEILNRLDVAKVHTVAAPACLYILVLTILVTKVAFADEETDGAWATDISIPDATHNVLVRLCARRVNFIGGSATGGHCRAASGVASAGRANPLHANGWLDLAKRLSRVYLLDEAGDGLCRDVARHDLLEEAGQGQVAIKWSRVFLILFNTDFKLDLAARVVDNLDA